MRIIIFIVFIMMIIIFLNELKNLSISFFKINYFKDVADINIKKHCNDIYCEAETGRYNIANNSYKLLLPNDIFNTKTYYFMILLIIIIFYINTFYKFIKYNNLYYPYIVDFDGTIIINFIKNLPYIFAFIVLLLIIVILIVRYAPTETAGYRNYFNTDNIKVSDIHFLNINEINNIINMILFIIVALYWICTSVSSLYEYPPEKKDTAIVNKNLSFGYLIITILLTYLILNIMNILLSFTENNYPKLDNNNFYNIILKNYNKELYETERDSKNFSKERLLFSCYTEYLDLNQISTTARTDIGKDIVYYEEKEGKILIKYGITVGNITIENIEEQKKYVHVVLYDNINYIEKKDNAADYPIEDNKKILKKNTYFEYVSPLIPYTKLINEDLFSLDGQTLLRYRDIHMIKYTNNSKIYDLSINSSSAEKLIDKYNKNNYYDPYYIIDNIKIGYLKEENIRDIIFKLLVDVSADIKSKADLVDTKETELTDTKNPIIVQGNTQGTSTVTTANGNVLLGTIDGNTITPPNGASIPLIDGNTETTNDGATISTTDKTSTITYGDAKAVIKSPEPFTSIDELILQLINIYKTFKLDSVVNNAIDERYILNIYFLNYIIKSRIILYFLTDVIKIDEISVKLIEYYTKHHINLHIYINRKTLSIRDPPITDILFIGLKPTIDDIVNKYIKEYTEKYKDYIDTILIYVEKIKNTIDNIIENKNIDKNDKLDVLYIIADVKNIINYIIVNILDKILIYYDYANNDISDEYIKKFIDYIANDINIYYNEKIKLLLDNYNKFKNLNLVEKYDSIIPDEYRSILAIIYNYNFQIYTVNDNVNIYYEIYKPYIFSIFKPYVEYLINFKFLLITNLIDNKEKELTNKRRSSNILSGILYEIEQKKREISNKIEQEVTRSKEGLAHLKNSLNEKYNVLLNLLIYFSLNEIKYWKDYKSKDIYNDDNYYPDYNYIETKIIPDYEKHKILLNLIKYFKEQKINSKKTIDNALKNNSLESVKNNLIGKIKEYTEYDDKNKKDEKDKKKPFFGKEYNMLNNLNEIKDNFSVDLSYNSENTFYEKYFNISNNDKNIYDIEYKIGYYFIKNIKNLIYYIILIIIVSIVLIILFYRNIQSSLSTFSYDVILPLIILLIFTFYITIFMNFNTNYNLNVIFGLFDSSYKRDLNDMNNLIIPFIKLHDNNQKKYDNDYYDLYIITNVLASFLYTEDSYSDTNIYLTMTTERKYSKEESVDYNNFKKYYETQFIEINKEFKNDWDANKNLSKLYNLIKEKIIEGTTYENKNKYIEKFTKYGTEYIIDIIKICLELFGNNKEAYKDNSFIKNYFYFEKDKNNDIIPHKFRLNTALLRKKINKDSEYYKEGDQNIKVFIDSTKIDSIKDIVKNYMTIISHLHFNTLLLKKLITPTDATLTTYFNNSNPVEKIDKIKSTDRPTYPTELELNKYLDDHLHKYKNKKLLSLISNNNIQKTDNQIFELAKGTFGVDTSGTTDTDGVKYIYMNMLENYKINVPNITENYLENIINTICYQINNREVIMNNNGDENKYIYSIKDKNSDAHQNSLNILHKANQCISFDFATNYTINLIMLGIVYYIGLYNNKIF